MRLVYENVHPNKLPAGYVELEYLQSDGNQYITTDLIPNSNYGVEISYRITSVGTDSAQAVFGSRDYVGVNSFSSFFGQIGIWVQFSNYSDSITTFQQQINVDYTYKGDKNSWFCNDIKLHDSITTSFKSTRNIDLFAIHQASGHNDRKMIGKIYYAYFTENGEYVGKFIPAKRKLDGVLGMYDVISNKFYTNLGTGNFIAGREIHYIEYLESTGTQYIDCNYKPNNNTKVHTIANFVDGGGLSIHGANPYFTLTSSSSGNVFSVRINGNYQATSKLCTKKSEVIIDKNRTYIDNDLVLTFPDSTFSSPYSMSIFSRSNSTGYEEISNSKIYRLKIYEFEKIKRNFLPAKDETGKGFMFDLVSHKIFDNNGTGNFICGEEKPYIKQKFLKSKDKFRFVISGTTT